MITSESSDVTAERESSTDLLAVDEEKFESSSKNKRKADEEYDENIESETESEEDDGNVTFENRKTLEDFQEPEPVWDYDSFDDRKLDPELRDSFDNEDDYNEYCNDRLQAWANKGFLPDPMEFIGPILGMDEPAFDNMTNREYLEDRAKLCVEELNKKKGKTVEFVSVVRGNMKGGAKWKVYITFMAREYPDGPLVEYQAKTMDFVGRTRPPFPILCRPAPKPLT